MDVLSSNPRESARHYIPASDADIKAMLEAVGKRDLRELYDHLPAAALRQGQLPLPEELDYRQTQERMASIAAKNRIRPSFIGDGLQDFSVHPVVAAVGSIRNLTTAYTPYQPERSQGTLLTQWIFQCVMTELTGFEAINSSLYERATGVFEAASTAIRLAKKADTVLVAANLYPGDIEVLKTQIEHTPINIEWLEPEDASGLLSAGKLAEKAAQIGDRLAGVVFPQVNNLGLLEEVDALTDAIHAAGALAIAVIDPLLLATGGLKQPALYGSSGQGADIIVGEAQHLATAPTFGGPGLGIFGVRHNDKVKQHVRATPGRYVGKAEDSAGRECCVMVLSTREQHIRKDKATSNICSNQAFLATQAGASVLARGNAGLAAMIQTARENALTFLLKSGAKPAFAEPFFNEVTVEVNNAAAFLERASAAGILAGVDVSDRIGGARQLVKLSFNDRQSAEAIEVLAGLFAEEPKARAGSAESLATVAQHLLRTEPLRLPQFSTEQVEDYYKRLGELNLSPDDGCYPLGSCTMKYNPVLNDWAAALTGFTDIHPQAPAEDAQGALEVLYEIQEWFKAITHLPAVTTQPVAGAQGELVGLKLFQAYHASRGEGHRNVVLLPRSAHGTNFATAAVAGMGSAVVNGVTEGIVVLEEDENGEICIEDFHKKIAEHGANLCGVMITNPNTRGLFETRFIEIAQAVHAAGGLVYMDGANMNAIAGWVDLNALGVDAVHNNLHKTWSIPHGGGGPGDGIVAVSEKLVDFLPGYQIEKAADGSFVPVKPKRSIGSFHRHWGNFGHKVRAYTYLLRLGRQGVRRMSAISVLAARYVLTQLEGRYPTLPAGAGSVPRMHEFILTLSEEDFAKLETVGISRALAATRVGKLFLDFGFHAPTVAWPEPLGLMIEPTESYTRAELDRFAQAVLKIKDVIENHPERLNTAPHFTPVDRVDEVAANRTLILSERLEELPPLHENRIDPETLIETDLDALYAKIVGG